MPAIGTDGTPIGLSSDGSALVLEASDRTSGRSRFAVLAADLTSDPTVIDLAGDFDVDGVSPGGTTLYLVERRDGRDYAIRSLDVASGTLDPEPVIDKREGGEAMVGSAVGRVVSTSWLHTLYLADEPFLHSLDSANSFTWCIDLDRSLRLARELALAVGPGGHAAWIVNLTGGTITPVNVDDGSVGHRLAVDRLAIGARGGNDSIGFDPALLAGNRLLIGTDRGLFAVDTAHNAATTVVSAGAVAGLGRSPSGRVVVVEADGSVDTAPDR